MSRPWRAKFADAGRGLAVAARTQSSFRTHLLATAAVGVAGAVAHCTATEWAILLVCVGLVLTAELLNTAVELLFRGLPQAERDRVYPALDVAAGGVLAASVCAAVAGLLVLVPRLLGGSRPL